VSLVVGIDAGGSSVAGRSDDAAFALAQGANVRTLGVELGAERILRVVKRLAGEAIPDALYVGAAGAADAALASELQRRLSRALPQSRVAVGDDLEIALRASIPTGDAVALIAGTGSVAYAEIAGKAYRAGGHGPLLGDEGSGFAIGRDALRITLRALDGRVARSGLTAEVERQFGASAHEMLERTAADQRAIAGIARLVVRYAENGDPVATAIVREAATNLYDLLEAALRKAGAERRELPLALVGGLVEEKNALRAMLESRVASESSLRIVATREPVLGALAFAHRLLERQKA
jgi:N-acetylglucosamine kinase-like BadF-type ATPase